MKKLSLIISIALFSLNTFAGHDLDATPSESTARKLAFDYAADQVFGDILDSDSSIKIVKSGEDSSGYVYLVTVNQCSVEVRVSKETGMAFNDEEMKCESR